jgi:hypothetical protein
MAGLSCIHWPVARAQLRFRVEKAGDGVATRILIPRQLITFHSPPPPYWLPKQSLSLLTTFNYAFPGRSAKPLPRRYHFQCPACGCRRRVSSLLLPLGDLFNAAAEPGPAAAESSVRPLFLCRHCLRIPRPYASFSTSTYRIAHSLFSATRYARSPLLELRALPLWLRWQAADKWARGPKPGEMWEEVRPL